MKTYTQSNIKMSSNLSETNFQTDSNNEEIEEILPKQPAEILSQHD